MSLQNKYINKMMYFLVAGGVRLGSSRIFTELCGNTSIKLKTKIYEFLLKNMQNFKKTKSFKLINLQIVGVC